MRIGVCTTIENLGTLEGLGFDYIELVLNRVVALNENDFLKVKSIIDASSVKCEACNGFFPWDMKIAGAYVDEAAVGEYIRRAVERAGRIGARIVVVGNGGSRRAVDGWNRQKAVEQFASALGRIGDEAGQYGITAAVEPLNLGETNIINSVKEGLELVKSINHPNVKLLADFYHMRKEEEDMRSILETGGYLKHLHIANSNGRRFPADKAEDLYSRFFSALKETGYSGRISIEASTDAFLEDAGKALKLLRGLTEPLN